MSSVAVHTIALSPSIFIPVTCSCSHLAVKSSAIAEAVTSTSSVHGTTVNMREVSHDYVTCAGLMYTTSCTLSIEQRRWQQV
jgi:hypothetical protein